MNNLLRSYNIKSTNTRIKILELFQDREELSIQDIIDYNLDVDTSTIYRTIDLFYEKNILKKEIDNGKVVYSLKTKHNHYVNCVKCNKRIKIDKCPFDDNVLKGFKVLDHTIYIEGICPKCQNK